MASRYTARIDPERLYSLREALDLSVAARWPVDERLYPGTLPDGTTVRPNTVRGFTEQEHVWTLARMVNAGEIQVHSKLTGVPRTFGETELVRQSTLNNPALVIDASDLRKFCQKLHIVVVESAATVTQPDVSKAEPSPLDDLDDLDDAPSPPPLKTVHLAIAFSGIEGRNSTKWQEWLADAGKHHKWMLPARATQGKAPTPSTWYPLKFASLLEERGVAFGDLNGIFVNSPLLRPWLPAWQEAKRDRNNAF